VATHYAELKTQLVSVLGADETLTGHLASATAIYYRWPRTEPTFPAIVFYFTTEYGQSTNKEGVRELSLNIDILGDDPDALDNAEEALRALLDESPSSLTTAGWACRRLRLLRSDQDRVERGDPSTHEPLDRNATTWSVKLYKIA